MSRHPDLGAGHPDNFDDRGDADFDCSYCGRTIYSGLLRAVDNGGSRSLLCSDCLRAQQERFAAEMSLDHQDAEHERGTVA